MRYVPGYVYLVPGDVVDVRPRHLPPEPLLGLGRRHRRRGIAAAAVVGGGGGGGRGAGGVALWEVVPDHRVDYLPEF